MKTRTKWLIAAAMFLVLVWNTGTFDRALVDVGLNRNECATTGLGATFCGDDLKRYERQVLEPMEEQQECADGTGPTPGTLGYERQCGP
jgi:hypothetical protein